MTLADAPSPNASTPAAATGGRSIRLILNLTGANDERVRDAVKSLRAEGHRVEVRVAWDGADAVTFAREAAEAGCEVVAAGGGDGTVNAVVRGLLSEGPLCAGGTCTTWLGIVPFGTANDLASACGLDAADPAPSLDLLARGLPRAIDVGRMNGIPFLNVASGGYAAEVTTDTDPGMKKALGGLAYWLTGIASLGRIEPRPVRVTATCPGKEDAGGEFRWEGRVYAVAVCNGRQAGGGLKLAPHAMLNDGLLDLAIIPEVPWTEFTTLYADLERLEDESPSERILFRQASRIVIEAPQGLQVNLDGEPHRGDRFEFTVEPERLCCLLPPDCGPLTHVPATVGAASPHAPRTEAAAGAV